MQNLVENGQTIKVISSNPSQSCSWNIFFLLNPYKKRIFNEVWVRSRMKQKTRLKLCITFSYRVKIPVVAEVNCPERGIIGIIAWKNPCLGGIYRFWVFSIRIHSSIKMQPKRIDDLIIMHVTSNTTFGAQISAKNQKNSALYDKHTTFPFW